MVFLALFYRIVFNVLFINLNSSSLLYNHMHILNSLSIILKSIQSSQLEHIVLQTLLYTISITFFRVGIPFKNKYGCMKVAKE